MILQRSSAAALVLMGALAGCGGAAQPDVAPDVPVVVAESVPFSETGLSPRPSPSPQEELPLAADDDDDADAAASGDADGDAGSPSPAPTRVGPTSGDAAAFVAGPALDGIASVEHVVVDLDGDTWDEVVITGTKGRAGVVRVAWWTSAGYEVLAGDQAGPGRTIADLRASDLNKDGTTELLVAVEGDGQRSLALWAVPRRGELQRLAAVGGCHDRSHVYGVTRARLEQVEDGPAVIVADCDESPLPIADWSEHRWAWDDGAYRHVPAPGDKDEGPDQDDGSGDDAPGNSGNSGNNGNRGDDDGRDDGDGDDDRDRREDDR